jgi:hypothetical protein
MPGWIKFLHAPVCCTKVGETEESDSVENYRQMFAQRGLQPKKRKKRGGSTISWHLSRHCMNKIFDCRYSDINGQGTWFGTSLAQLNCLLQALVIGSMKDS